MANHNISLPRIFTDFIRKFETTDKGHADVFNNVINPLINNDVYLKEFSEAIKEVVDTHTEDIDIHVTTVDKENWNSKADATLATQEKQGLLSAADKKKLDGVAEKAEVNQNAISKVKSGGITVSANGKESAIELAAGSHIEISADNGTKIITINVDETNINADQVDGKHAKVTLDTEEKEDLAGAINEVFNTKLASSKVVENRNITEDGFVMGGKTCSEAIAELNSNLTKVDLEKAPLKSPYFNEIYVLDSRILRTDGALVIYVGNHSFSFNKNGSFWIDNTLIGSVR